MLGRACIIFFCAFLLALTSCSVDNLAWNKSWGIKAKALEPNFDQVSGGKLITISLEKLGDGNYIKSYQPRTRTFATLEKVHDLYVASLGLEVVEVRFGEAPGSDFTYDEKSDQIKVIAPPHAKGYVDVSILSKDGYQLTLTEKFEYRDGSETILAEAGLPGSSSPFGDGSSSSGSGSSSNGDGALASSSGSSSNGDGSSASSGGSSSSAPVLSSISPTSGPVTGRTEVLIAGEGFFNPSVSIGGVPCTVKSSSSNSVTCQTGKSALPGTFDVVLLNADGRQAVLPQSFTYEPASCKRESSVGALFSTSASSVTAAAGGICSWSNTLYAREDDGFIASCGSFGATSGTRTPALDLKGFFVGQSIPLDAEIRGIIVRCEWGSVFANGAMRNRSMRLLKNGIPVGADLFDLAHLPENKIELSCDYGSSTDLWDTTWTAAEILDPNFGVQVQFEREERGVTADIDHCEIAVYWR